MALLLCLPLSLSTTKTTTTTTKVTTVSSSAAAASLLLANVVMNSRINSDNNNNNNKNIDNNNNKNNDDNNNDDELDKNCIEKRLKQTSLSLSSSSDLNIDSMFETTLSSSLPSSSSSSSIIQTICHQAKSIFQQKSKLKSKKQQQQQHQQHEHQQNQQHKQQQQQSFDELRRASWPITILNSLNNKLNQQQQQSIKLINLNKQQKSSSSSLFDSSHYHCHHVQRKSLSSTLHHHDHQPNIDIMQPQIFSSPITTTVTNSLSSTTTTTTVYNSKTMMISTENIDNHLPSIIQSQQQQQPPPSVIISDHSTMDNIIHSIIQFDSDSGENGYESSNDNNNNNNNRHDSLFGCCSSSSLYSSTSSLSSSMGDDDYDVDYYYVDYDSDVFHSSSKQQSETKTTAKKSSKWRKVRSLVTSPFIQTYKRKKYPWIQLAGHQGNFVAGQIQGTIMKKLCGNEIDCFQKLMSDPQLSVLVPEFKNIRIVNGETYLELEDLLATFVNPSVMDIKMGIRTYLEEELVKANEKPRLRKDMYEKMVAIDPEEPSNEEKEQKAITKPRYMVWRETISSTSTLGFRIDGMKSGDNHHRLKTTTATVKDFKRTKSIESVRSAILEFVGDKHEYLITYLEKLKFIRKQLEQSKFFQTHEMIGSSLLLVHDQQHANIWMIDFAKTYPLPDDININHRDQWTLGNHEDGYLFGLDNLIEIFSSLCCNSSTSSTTTTTTPSSS